MTARGREDADDYVLLLTRPLLLLCAEDAVWPRREYSAPEEALASGYSDYGAGDPNAMVVYGAGMGGGMGGGMPQQMGGYGGGGGYGY